MFKQFNDSTFSAHTRTSQHQSDDELLLVRAGVDVDGAEVRTGAAVHAPLGNCTRNVCGYVCLVCVFVRSCHSNIFAGNNMLYPNYIVHCCHSKSIDSTVIKILQPLDTYLTNLNCLAHPSNSIYTLCLLYHVFVIEKTNKWLRSAPALEYFVSSLMYTNHMLSTSTFLFFLFWQTCLQRILHSSCDRADKPRHMLRQSTLIR